jgi:chromosome segregation ATPase
MKQRIILGVMITALFFSCNVKENEELRSKVEALEVELKVTKQAADQLQEVSVMLDSIESNRIILNSGLVEGTNYSDYSTRLRNLNTYIKNTQSKLTELEATLKKSKSSVASYAALTRKLKAELEASTQRIAALTEEVESMRASNNLLTESVKQKEALLDEKNEMIKLREESIASLEVKVKDITSTATLTQADLLFAQGQAMELAAARTKLAPRKKKETQREALELYKRSFSLGKQEAQERINALEKVVG